LTRAVFSLRLWSSLKLWRKTSWSKSLFSRRTTPRHVPFAFS
jgi:hypothetical protein